MASPFARAEETVPIPFHPPNEVTVRQLNGRQLGKAQKAFFNDLIADVQARGGAKVQKDVQELFADPKAGEEAVKKIQADPLNGFDKYTLLYDGIKSWTYPDSLERVAVTEETSDGRSITVMRIPAIDAMNDEAVDWFATQVLRLSKPALFLSAEEKAVEQKKADGVPSIAE